MIPLNYKRSDLGLPEKLSNVHVYLHRFAKAGKRSAQVVFASAHWYDIT